MNSPQVIADSVKDSEQFPNLAVEAESVPEAFFIAMKKVWNQGLAIRTEYDRQNSQGDFIDPPSRDSRMMVVIKNPFSQPRFPPLSFCELGVYLAEIMGVKDNLVVPFLTLEQVADGRELDNTQWPYTYHQRLFKHPSSKNNLINQIELILKRTADTPHTRRAVATTAMPAIDPFLQEDIPCLREIQIRCSPSKKGGFWLNFLTVWRSRDLYKAWGDNVIALTFLQQWLAGELTKRIGQPVRVGCYTDFSMSLHIYGQDFEKVGGDREKGLQSFFETFKTANDLIAKSLDGESAKEMMMIPQLKNLTSPTAVSQWKMGPKEIKTVNWLIDGLEDGSLEP